MPDLVRKIVAGAAITLGCAHLLYGVLAFKALTPDHIWFAGAGIAMICAASPIGEDLRVSKPQS